MRTADNIAAGIEDGSPAVDVVVVALENIAGFIGDEHDMPEGVLMEVEGLAVDDGGEGLIKAATG